MKVFLNALLILFALIAAGPSAEKEGIFKMLSANQISGLIPDIDDGYGMAFRDFNGDGYPDIYLVCFRNLNRLLINNGGIIPFVDRTIQSGLGGFLMPRGRTNLEVGACAADYDNDGRPDLFLAGWGKTHRLFRNMIDIGFEDVTTNLNLLGLVDANQGLWFDADNDGYLDLFVTDEHRTNRFLINKKNGFFEETLWTESLLDTAVSQGAWASDFDGDGDSDLYVCNWFSRDYLLLNRGQGLFDTLILNLPTLQETYSSNSAAAADVDNDGDPDIFVATREGKVFFYKNESQKGRLRFVPLTNHPFFDVGDGVYGLLFADFNHDGWQDCFLSVKGKNRLYLNDRQGGFCPEYDSDGHSAYSTGSAAADLDNDGDLDLFVSNKNDLSQIYLNPMNDGRFLKMRLVGVRSNRDAIGAKIYFYSADSLPRLLGFREVSVQQGYLSSGEPLVHFGCGDHQSLTAEIIFPSGRKILRTQLTPGHEYKIREYGEPLSAAYFAWKAGRILVSRAVFWIDAALALFFLLMIFTHIRLGLRRYHWSAAVMNSQLIVWFVLTLILFIILREVQLQIVLITMSSISFLSVTVIALYSEHLLALRKKRSRFRQILQDLSDQMITIHDNHTLFQNLLAAIRQHDAILRAELLLYSDKNLVVFTNGAARATSSPNMILLTETQIHRLVTRSLLFQSSEKEFNQIFDSQDINLLLPIRHDQEIFATIGMKMLNSHALVNREDLQLLLPIANQMAIAIENNNYIKESAELVRQLTEAQTREKYLKQLEETNRQLDQKNAELLRLFKELQEKESQLIHSEKMASLGQLVAGISHELNNPISFIYANSQALTEYVTELEAIWSEVGMEAGSEWQQRFAEIINELKAIIADTVNGSRSVKELVLHLKNFSRLDQAEWKEARVVSGIESSLRIMQHQIPARIEVIKEFGADPAIYCNAGQLNQVFVNLISNAIQAIPDSGKIYLKTKQSDERLIIEIADTGRGIPQEILPKIFDPFFTTKDVSKGTGLGLTISYAIIQKHNGMLTVSSEEGKGSVFTIALPLL